MNAKLLALLEYAKQPSTIKGIIILLGLAGVKADPTKIEQIIGAFLLVYAAVQIFYEQNPRKPPEPPAPPPAS